MGKSLARRRGHTPHQTPGSVDDGDRGPSEQACQTGGFFITVPDLEENGVIHNVTNAHAALGYFERFPGNDTNELSFVDDGSHRMLHEPQGIADQEVPTDI